MGEKFGSNENNITDEELMMEALKEPTKEEVEILKQRDKLVNEIESILKKVNLQYDIFIEKVEKDGGIIFTDNITTVSVKNLSKYCDLLNSICSNKKELLLEDEFDFIYRHLELIDKILISSEIAKSNIKN